MVTSTDLRPSATGGAELAAGHPPKTVTSIDRAVAIRDTRLAQSITAWETSDQNPSAGPMVARRRPGGLAFAEREGAGDFVSAAIVLGQLTSVNQPRNVRAARNTRG